MSTSTTDMAELEAHHIEGLSFLSSNPIDGCAMIDPLSPSIEEVRRPSHVVYDLRRG